MPRQPYDEEFMRDIARCQREHEEQVAAQTWRAFWAAGNSCRYDQLSYFLRACVVQQTNTVPTADSLWHFHDGEAIPAEEVTR